MPTALHVLFFFTSYRQKLFINSAVSWPLMSAITFSPLKTTDPWYPTSRRKALLETKPTVGTSLTEISSASAILTLSFMCSDLTFDPEVSFVTPCEKFQLNWQVPETKITKRVHEIDKWNVQNFIYPP